MGGALDKHSRPFQTTYGEKNGQFRALVFVNVSILGLTHQSHNGRTIECVSENLPLPLHLYFRR